MSLLRDCHFWVSSASSLVQFCFMLSLFATLPKTHGGLDGTVVYIDTEKKFSSLRYFALCRGRRHQNTRLVTPLPFSCKEEEKRIWGHNALTLNCVSIDYPGLSVPKAESECRFVEIAQTRFPEEFNSINQTAIQEVSLSERNYSAADWEFSENIWPFKRCFSYHIAYALKIVFAFMGILHQYIVKLNCASRRSSRSWHLEWLWSRRTLLQISQKGTLKCVVLQLFSALWGPSSSAQSSF